MTAYFNRVMIQHISAGNTVALEATFAFQTSKSYNRANMMVADHLRRVPPANEVTEIRIKVYKQSPRELDVPHWAIEPTRKMRRVYDLPEYVTDRMIFAWLQDSSPMHRDESEIRELIELARGAV